MSGAMNLIQRARDSGKCSPSLLLSQQQVDQDGFEEGVLKALDSTGFQLRPEAQAADDFMPLLQKADSTDSVQAASDEMKKATLVQRRCLLLAIVGGSDVSSSSVSRLLSNGYLTSVKKWLDEILNGSIGGVDLLLHLLSNIATLPVTKQIVKSSGMGKIIGTLEKHRMCSDTPNAPAIKERIQRLKDEWNASVKARKSQDQMSKQPLLGVTNDDPSSSGDRKVEPKSADKRPVENGSSPAPSSKRVKLSDDSKKSASSSFSNLLKKVAGPSKDEKVPSQSSDEPKSAKANGSEKKVAKRVKWADHFGGVLVAAQTIEGEELADGAPAAPSETPGSWSDRKKRDRMREKELLAKAKKAKLLDDDEVDDVVAERSKAIVPTMTWRIPSLLPDRPDVTKPELVSHEKALQDDRMNKIPAVHYLNEYDIPSNPDSLTDVEQALDMTSQSSATLESIPFFVPQQPAQALALSIDPSSVYTDATSSIPPTSFPPQQPQYGAPLSFHGQSTAATPEFVQALGLPLFLVGQDTQALQTIANSPGLLGTLVDPSGMYDQARLMSLVQTLSSSNGNHGQQMQPSFGQPPPVTGIYGQSQVTAPPTYGATPAYSAPPPSGGFRSSSDAGNLHISGFGPSTTSADIIQMFAPYVRVDEVVMKGNFAFVNTSDPVNAPIAREALSGTLLGGMPVRINPAQRKTPRQEGSAYGPAGGAGITPPPAPGLTHQPPRVPPPITNHMQAPPAMQQNVNDVRDDRGNPATKNLFVAGYGPGTTEQQLRDMFSQTAEIIGVVLKGSFSFVNTCSREQAVACRQVFGGTMLNGGVLRINFAKETGRLGTSFDLTYGKDTGPNAKRGPGPVGHPIGGGPQTYYGP